MNINPGQDHSNIGSRKAQIRREMIRRREGLSPADCEAASSGLREQVLSLLSRLSLNERPLKIGVYAAIRHEPDLSAVWADLQRLPAYLCFPAVRGQGAAARLVFGQVPDSCKPADFLMPGRFGITEPPPESWMPEPPALDLVLLPGLAFDRQGNRLGWGKAFYDRFLQTLAKRPVLAGICYPFQILPESLPVEPTDYPVDWLVTPDNCLKVIF